ncbi:MAG: DNA mismatch repair protein MutS [Flavobacteriales bacterium]|nr:DNA mismatch repair protein MutS [Flavobacteriales bacterium]
MEKILTHYKERKSIAEQHVKMLGARINTLVVFRVLVFSIGVTLIILFFAKAWLSVLVGVTTAVLFGFLIKYHLRKKEEQRFWKEVALFYDNEIKGVNGDWSFANNGEDYHVPDHEFAYDIDLFGERSFFQRVNRTSLNGGERFLAKLFLSNDTSQIDSLQEANKELREKNSLTESFVGYARINDAEVSPEVVRSWLLSFKAFLPSYSSFLGIGFSLLSIGVLFMFSAGWISGLYLSGWIVLGLGVIGIWLKKITKLNGEINKVVSSIKSYGKLLYLIEAEEFRSERLSSLKSKIVHSNSTASEVIDQLSRNIDLFNNRNNLIVAMLGNGFFLWDLQTTFRLQKWLVRHAEEVVDWLDVLYELDALLSLAIYSKNHPGFNYPVIDHNGNIYGKSLGHPLIKRAVCVTNDVDIKPASFLIITGANMAGKSTFLRTISLAILMTNLGLPVYADELRIKPQKLITSMRSSDSLLEDESYFFAELKRLKFIIEQIDTSNYFIVLDEILKGTNSKDKEEGSKKFVRRLVEMGATGIIATHDLGLCTIEQELSQVNNYYFDAEIINDELHFDYRMKNGVCKNMNASFLLRKMNIVSD